MPERFLEGFRDWSGFLAFVFAAAFGALGWWMGVKRQEWSVERELGALRDRFTAIEGKIREIERQERLDGNALAVLSTRVAADVEHIKGGLDRLADKVDRLKG